MHSITISALMGCVELFNIVTVVKNNIPLLEMSVVYRKDATRTVQQNNTAQSEMFILLLFLTYNVLKK